VTNSGRNRRLFKSLREACMDRGVFFPVSDRGGV
jgi:hypothetical protein